MRKFVKYILLVFLPSFIIFTVNLVIDSQGYVHKTVVNGFVSELEKNNVSLFLTIPERLVVKKRIEDKRKSHFNKIVIGSSRTMFLGYPIGENVFNLSMASAVLEDYEIVIDLLEENSISFDTIVISGDPWILNENHNDDQYLSFNRNLNLENLTNLLSLEYFFKNIKFPKYSVWDGNDNDFVKFKDGTIRSNVENRLVPGASVDGFTERDTIFRLGGFDSINDYSVRFEKLLQRVVNDNIIVEIVLVPYHPDIYHKLLQRVPMVQRAEEKFNEFKTDKIIIIGSFNPFYLNFDKFLFNDALHLNEIGMKKLYESKQK